PFRNELGKLIMTLVAVTDTPRGTGNSVTAKIQRMEMNLSPLEADLTVRDKRVGKVSFQVKTLLKSLPGGAALKIFTSKSPDNDTANALSLAASRIGAKVLDVAFLVNVIKTNLVNEKDVGEATITMTVGKTWVDAVTNRNIAIVQIPEDGGAEILLTKSFPTAAGDKIAFEAVSPRGLSIFALVALDSPAPTPTPAPVFHALKVVNDTPVYGNIDISPPGDNGKYLNGTLVTLKAVSNRGYKFNYWYGDAVGQSLEVVVKIDGDKTVAAAFQKNTYTISIDSVPRDGGIVVLSPYLSEYEYGTNVVATAEPYEGYIFNSWSGDLAGSQDTLNFTMDGEKNLVANFSQRQFSFATSVFPPGAGAINPPAGSGTLGSTVNLIATANQGYIFSSWSGDVTGSKNPVMVPITKDVNVIANFVKARYSLIVTTSPVEAGNVNTTGGTYEFGDTVVLSATTRSGHTFIGWGGDASGTSNPLNLRILKNTVVVANFSTRNYSVSVSVNPPIGGFVRPAARSYYTLGSFVELEAIPNVGYEFNVWTGSMFSQSTIINFQIFADMTFVVHFIPAPTPTPVPPVPTPTPTPAPTPTATPTP
ncbi:InlB B-repeat-containing protein, partial [Chloroflexota bacterium]